MKALLVALTVSTVIALGSAASVQAADANKAAPAPEIQMFDIAHSVLKMELVEGVTPDAAAEAMLSKAAEINMKLVGQLNVSQEVRNRGIDAPRLQIFQFCNPEDAIRMVEFNTIYAAYMPCRIALVEDNQGKVWLEMLNLDMIIQAYPLPPELQALALNVNGQMLDIITAGATGEF
ncbi:MAG: DUF302 domain-containing protein [Chromatiaceae bacterium]|jgi:uncharacterized protein (DUF302 family)